MLYGSVSALLRQVLSGTIVPYRMKKTFFIYHLYFWYRYSTGTILPDTTTMVFLIKIYTIGHHSFHYLTSKLHSCMRIRANYYDGTFFGNIFVVFRANLSHKTFYMKEKIWTYILPYLKTGILLFFRSLKKKSSKNGKESSKMLGIPFCMHSLIDTFSFVLKFFARTDFKLH